MTKKISIIGAGNVGATLALRILEANLGDVVLLDIIKNLAVGKAYDLQDSAAILGLHVNIKGTDDYGDLADSDIVVVTAGKSRRPGMSRDDLLRENATIIKDIAANIKRYLKDAIVIVVTNPLDVMSYLLYKITDFSSKKVIGMAGLLDSGRLSFILSDYFKAPPGDIQSLILGSHGDSMVPIFNETFLNNKPVSSLLPDEKLSEVKEKVQKRGADIVSLLGTGSAYYGPSAAIFLMIKSIINNENKIFPVSAYLQGEYGLNDIFIGVPAKLGKDGIQEIIELKLNKKQQEAFLTSANSIKLTIKQLGLS